MYGVGQIHVSSLLLYLGYNKCSSHPAVRYLTIAVLGLAATRCYPELITTDFIYYLDGEKKETNRAVEVNEMWRAREKELELDKRVTGTSKDKSSSDRSHRDHNSSRSTGRHAGADKSTSTSDSCSTKKEYEHSPEGLKDEELEEFLHSRTKRGRGAIGPRMDETGPYLPPHPDGETSTSHDVRERRVIYGPVRPASLQSYESSEEEELHEEKRKKHKKSRKSQSDKEQSKKRRSKEKSKHKKKKREEKRSKHHG